MNAVIDAILSRRSIRSFTPAVPTQQEIEQLLTCAQFAPSAMGRQPWHFTVVRGRRLLDAICEGNRNIMRQSPDPQVRAMAEDPSFDNFRTAPCAIIVSGTEGRFVDMDCANAMENMALAAHAIGLGSCYIGSLLPALEGPEAPALYKALGIPEGYTVRAALAVGYPAAAPAERVPRREGTVNYAE